MRWAEEAEREERVGGFKAESRKICVGDFLETGSFCWCLNFADLGFCSGGGAGMKELL